MRLWLFAALLGVSGGACAQADIGLVNMVSGEARYASDGVSGAPVKAFMRVREGDRFDVPAGAQVRVVYFDGARQERWNGPAAFRAGKSQGQAINGAPAEVSTIPSSASVRIARVPELMQNARLGGIQVRSAQAARPVQETAVREARATYERWRKDAAADDITPELFLYSALNEYQLYEDMAPVVGEMLRRQPGSDDVRALDAWLKTRRGK